MNFLLLSLFFLAPQSTFQDVSVEIFGKVHHYPASIYRQIEPVPFDEAYAIARLSAEIPNLYDGQSSLEEFPFRPGFIYKILLKGYDLGLARAKKREHFFFVFKDTQGNIQGYIHGFCHLSTGQAAVDELVVAPDWKKQRVERALMGRLLVEFSRRAKSKVRFLSRDSRHRKLAKLYGMQWQRQNFDLTLVVDHLISRYSLEYLNHVDPSQVNRFSEVALEIKTALKKAKSKDRLKDLPALSYLDSLASRMNATVGAKFKQRGESYEGIQFDKSELANIYFTMYLIATLSQDKAIRKSRHYYFSLAIYEMGQAQREGGILPSHIQIHKAKLYSFARIFENVRADSDKDKRWVLNAIHQYLRLLDLKEIVDRFILVPDALIEMAIREILRFHCPDSAAGKIAFEICQARSALRVQWKKGQFTIQEKENMALEAFKKIQKEVLEEFNYLLETRYGLLFFYYLPIYSAEALHWRLGNLFLLACFHDGKSLRSYGIEPFNRIYSKRRPSVRSSPVRFLLGLLKEPPLDFLAEESFLAQRDGHLTRHQRSRIVRVVKGLSESPFRKSLPLSHRREFEFSL